MIKTIRGMFGVLATIIILMSLFAGAGNISASQAVVQNHPQPDIWKYENEKNQPTTALILEIQHVNWQFTAAACITPAFIDRYHSTPILFDDGSDSSTIEIPHENKTVVSFGGDIYTATQNIAKTYWTKAEIVVIAGSYEQVLWAVPIASFLSAPILVNPNSNTLQEIGTRCAIVVGGSDSEVDEVIRLDTKEDLWKFQLELYDTKGQICDYVILTNPHDTDDSLDPNIKWPYLSLASAPLAAFRHAIVQTGDWITDKSKIEALELKTAKDDTLYNEVKPYFEKVKDDSYEVEEFLLDLSHNPEYLAVVGGPYAIPNYFYDIIVHYKYPLNNPQVTVYPSSIGAYATPQETVPNNHYIKEDLASGRILASSIFDASKQLMKTFFYKEFLPSGIYNSVAPSNWQNKASVVDGHRLNQPEPNNLIWDPKIPYHPAGPVENIFVNASLDTTYYLPRNESNPFDQNKTIFEIMNIVTNSSLIQFLPHGGKTSLRIEIGVEPITSELKSTYLTSSHVRDLNFNSPTIVYTGCCKGANPFMLDEGLNITDFVIPAFIHAGCVAYIATPEIQSTCFWREAPYGVSTQQTIFTWEKLLSSNEPIGKALRDAKWDAHEWACEMWPQEPDVNDTFEVDCITYNLFGDPALEPYKPDIPFDTTKEMEVHVSYGEVKAGEKLNVNVDVTDLVTTQSITDAQITVKFNGKTETGYTASFDVPNEEGDYKIEISVDKDGYHDLTAKYRTFVEKGEEEDNILLILGITILLIAIVVIVKTRKK